MQAGGAVWHTGGPLLEAIRGGEPGRGGISGFQLWLALPPSLELSEPESPYVDAAAVPQVGPARVILGRHDSATIPIPPIADLSNLQITLAAGERITYRPPSAHSVLWLVIGSGALRVSGTSLGMELEAEVATEFVLGSAMPHPHPLVLGHYSVHTTASALAAGESGVRLVRERLRADGRF